MEELIYSVENLLAVANKKQWPINEQYNIFGVRRFDNLDQFTDKKIVIRKVAGVWDMFQFDQTTKPGLDALKEIKGGNKEGCGTLQEGYYKDSWIIGFHQFKNDISHRALIQCVPVLPVYRDKEKDGIIKYDEQHLFKDGAGINHHSTWIGHRDEKIGIVTFDIKSNYRYPKVSTWSEACQVAALPLDQQKFMDWNDLAEKEFGMKKFSYGLFNVNDFK